MTEARPSNYWIASNALYITLNANGGPDYLLGNTASGAHILCYMKGIDGLEYDAGHNYRRWPLSLTPTHFETYTEKYVYCAIPRPGNAAEMAVIVFPSERLDIYGKNEIGQQIGSEQYYYIWLQGIISSSGVTGANDRGWTQHIDTGTLASDEAMNAGGDETWWRYSAVDDTVTFLKEIVMDAKSVFHNLKARLLVLAGHELTGVATADTPDEFVDSETLVVTPSYLKKNTEDKFLRKDQDDATPYSLTVGGILRAATGYFTSLYSNLVRSTNYTGDGIADTGYRLTADYNGHSKLTIDEIYVRMKAVFESLEVRERTYTGGDQIWSCAGNRINRVDYLGNVETADHAPEMMDVHADGRPAGTGEGDVYSVPVPGDTYGYSYVKVPWLLRQMPFLLRHRFFGRLRRVRIILNEQEDVSGRRAGGADSQIGKIRRARCYFLAKDDDMEVHNWWRINDLARCQTMNLANTTRQTYISGEDQKAGNIFWWRKVIGVSYEPVTLDDGKEYHYFDVAFDYLLEQEHPEVMATSVMEGSDIPAAQDSVVQFGNTIIEGRMNLMMMEVNGGDAVGYNPTTDAPCLKAYRGVYCFDLNKSWVGGNARKMMLSPKSGYEFYGPNFKQVTEYDVVPVPVDRGLWLNITPTRDDYREHAMVRKCYYYDKVSHNGSYWLCSIVEGAHWVDGNGDYISDAAYSALTEEQKALCSRKQNYTIEEPSANSRDWTEVVQKGDKGDNMIRLDISNEMDMIPTTSALRIDVARTVETTVRLFDGATEVDISAATLSPTGGPASSIATFSQAADGKGKKLSWAFKAGQTMAEAYDITLSYTYKNVAYTEVFTVSASKGEAVWQLKPSLSAIPFQRNADNTLTPDSRAVGLSLVKIDGGSTATYTSVQTGLTVRYSTSSMPTSASAGRGWSSGNITVANTADNLYIAMFNASGVLLDRETIPVIKDGKTGEKGSDGSYYVEDYGIGASRDNHNDISTWNSTPPTPTTQKPYVWKRSRLYNPNTQTYGNATYVCLTGEKGVNGKDGWMITANPANVIITQSLNNNTSSFSSATVSFVAKKGSANATITSIAIPTGKQSLSDEFNATISGKTVVVSSPKTHGSPAEYYTEGSFTVTVNVTDPDTGSTVSFNVTVLCYANLLGSWKEKVEGDTKTEVARQLTYGYDPDSGQVIALSTFGEYIKSSEVNISTLSKKVNGLETSTSEIKQTADEIKMSVNSGFRNFILNPKATDAIKAEGQMEEDNDVVMGRVMNVFYSGTGNFQLLCRFDDDNRTLLNNQKVVCYMVVKPLSSPGTICFGTWSATHHYPAILRATYNGSDISVNSDGVGEAKTGAVPVGNGWYICWSSFNAGAIFSEVKESNGINSVNGTRWDVYGYGILVGEGCPSLEAILTNTGLRSTGIDILDGNIIAKADNFSIVNSNDKETFSVDKDGNLIANGGSITAQGTSKSRWEISTEVHEGLYKIPTIIGYDTAGNKKIQLIYDGDAGDIVTVGYGGGLSFLKQEESGETSVAGGYFQNYWRVISSSGGSFIDAMSGGSPVIHCQYESQNTLNIGADSNGAMLKSNNWPTQTADEGRVYKDAWCRLRVYEYGNNTVDAINVKTSSFTLPTDPPVGTQFFVKKMSDNMTIRTSDAYVLNGSNNGTLWEPNTTYNWDDTHSMVLFYLGKIGNFKYWTMIYSN